MLKTFCDAILEQRYKPNVLFHDYRGQWIKVLSDRLALENWKLADNVIELVDDPETMTVRAMCQSGRAGLSIYDPGSAEKWRQTASSFVETLFVMRGFESPLSVKRVGVRGKFLRESPLSFDELVERFSKSYVQSSGRAVPAFDAKLVDISAAFNFRDSKGHSFNTNSGPMNRDEMERVMAVKRPNFPLAAMFFDIDYFDQPNREMKPSELTGVVDSFTAGAWERFETAVGLLDG